MNSEHKLLYSEYKNSKKCKGSVVLLTKFSRKTIIHRYVLSIIYNLNKILFFSHKTLERKSRKLNEPYVNNNIFILAYTFIIS